jgi:hypothetical protein
MNLPRCCADKVLVVAYVLGALGTLLIMAVLVNFMHRYTRPEPITQTQADQRRKNLADIRTTSSNELHTVAWRDQPKQIARIPIDRAIELTLNEWKSPAAARSNLISLAEKAFAKPPEKPNPFE